MEDANFVFDMADAGLLRLYTFLHWVEEMIQIRSKSEFRTGPTDNFVDKVFENEINRLINLTKNHYEETLYKEALKTGFFEFQVKELFLYKNKGLNRLASARMC